MHTETDRATYYQTLSKITGRSVRYLRVRTAVRIALCAALAGIPFASILLTK